jgi:hypothetical protein
MVRICPIAADEKSRVDKQPTAEGLTGLLMNQAQELASLARDPRAVDDEVTLREFEKTIIPRVFEIGCTAVALFLACCEERIREQTPTQLVSGESRKTAS